MKEDYENVKELLARTKYDEHLWDVCGDFKMIGFLLGLQAGYTKYSCFLCLWDSRAATEHYKRIDWPLRTELEPGKFNVAKQPLVQRDKILLPPLHIKLGLIKKFGIFIGPQVKVMLASEELFTKMNDVEKKAWRAIADVVTGFLGNNKAPNYKDLVSRMIKAYENMGCRMSLKLHYLHSHLDFFS